jgi:hypothetical protein
MPAIVEVTEEPPLGGLPPLPGSPAAVAAAESEDFDRPLAHVAPRQVRLRLQNGLARCRLQAAQQPITGSAQQPSRKCWLNRRAG